MDKIAEYFDGKIYNYRGIPELKVATPWKPVWLQRSINDNEGINYRPEYYRELGLTYNNMPSQAVATRFSTHKGGVVQGPLQFPKGIRLHFNMFGMMKTDLNNVGEGRLFTFISESETEGHIDFVPQYIGEEWTNLYDTWLVSGIDYVTTGNPIYVGGYTTWKYRSPLCCTLWGHAMLSVEGGYGTESLPVIKTLEHPDYTVEFLMRITPK